VTVDGHSGEIEAGVTDGTGDADRDRPRKLDADESADGDESEGEGTNWRVFAYDIVNSAVAVLLVGALLFAISGVWPPMVAVESPSMDPHMKTGDLVFVMEETRFPGEGAEAGVVTARVGETTDVDYRKFDRQGDVIVYRPDGNGDTTPIIHRAMFWVEEGENWYDKADKQSIGRYSVCGNSTSEALPNCPAPHAGFITKGDANGRYDQVDQLSEPVRPAWVVGTAEVRIPKLGCLRLRSDRCANGVFGVVGQTAPPGCERCRVPAG
jgi:signal peptidase